MDKVRVFTQITKEQRLKMEVLLQAGYSKSAIAENIGKHISSIYRECSRNVPRRGIGAKQYKADAAQRKTDLRHCNKPKYCKFDEGMKQQVRELMINDKLSPELISHKGRRELGTFVSGEVIYRWIWEKKFSNKRTDRQDRNLYRHLRHGKRKRKRGNSHDNRGRIPNRTLIDERPLIINKRKRVGDKEADLVMGKNHQPGLLVVTDRKTRKCWLEKIASKEASHIVKQMKKIHKRCACPIKTITFDNDLAFARHEQLAESLNIKTYFTHPYSSQEKGTVENRIGVIRMFFDKKTDFSRITAKQVREVERKINDRPLRMFGYMSANQVYKKFAFIS